MKLFDLASGLSLLTDILYFRGIEVKECVLPSRFQQPLALEISQTAHLSFFLLYTCKKQRGLYYFNRWLSTVMCSVCCASLCCGLAEGHLHEQSKLNPRTLTLTVQCKSLSFEKMIPSKWIRTGNKK